MKWFYVVSETPEGSNKTVHSKHRTRVTAEKRIPIKMRHFRTAGLERVAYLVIAEGWGLGLPPELKEYSGVL